MLFVGCHLSGKSLIDVFDTLHSIGGNAVQIFLSSPMNSSAPKKISKIEKEIVEKSGFRKNPPSGIYIVVHGKYVLNFCRSLSNSPWQGTCLVEDMVEAMKIGADVVIHQGKNLPELKQTLQQAYAVFVENLVDVLNRTSAVGCTNKILLENSCHQGNELGYTVQQLYEIWSLIPLDVRGRVGFCLDLCHGFVAGMELRTRAGVAGVFEEFDRLIGLEWLKVIHFNDSKSGGGCCRDAHADLMAGFIGNPLLGGGYEGFQEVVRIANLRSIPMILETPADLVDLGEQIEFIEKLSKGDCDEIKKIMGRNSEAMMEGLSFVKDKTRKKIAIKVLPSN